MFAMVFSHKEIAKPFLEAVLGIKIYELKEPEPEKTVEVSPVHKGIRYDVFVKETGPGGEILRNFDIEMQMEDNKEISKRTRYYQAMCDSESLNKGEVYYNLKELYIMFLCSKIWKSMTRKSNWETSASKIFELRSKFAAARKSQTSLTFLSPCRIYYIQ